MDSIFNELTGEQRKHTCGTILQVSEEGVKINFSWNGRVEGRALGKHEKGDMVLKIESRI